MRFNRNASCGKFKRTDCRTHHAQVLSPWTLVCARQYITIRQHRNLGPFAIFNKSAYIADHPADRSKFQKMEWIYTEALPLVRKNSDMENGLLYARWSPKYGLVIGKCDPQTLRVYTRYILADCAYNEGTPLSITRLAGNPGQTKEEIIEKVVKNFKIALDI